MTGYPDYDEIGPAVREEARRRRRARQQAARLRARRARFTAFVTIASIITLIVAWRALLPIEPGLAFDRAEPQTQTSLISASTSTSEDEVSTDPVTPVFASYRSLQLFLPVLEAHLTEVAFHQASGVNALPMESYLPDADMTAAANKQGTGRPAPDPDAAPVASSADEPRVLGGEALRMWRASRRGAPDNAADIGAAPGSPVYAPVTGTILEVKTYSLYGEHEDIEIHIQPSGWPEIDLVIIHVIDPTVSVGDRVYGGVTQIASVRLLSDRVNHQLGDYTTDPGDHIHMQLNRVEKPGVTVPAEES